MSKVYLSYNNIVSSLGFDSKTVVNNIHNEVSGLQLRQFYKIRANDANIVK